MSDIKHKTIYKDEDCEVFLETFHDMLLIHCYIHKWKKSLVVKYDVILEQLLAQLRSRDIPYLYAAILPSDLKLKKFSDMFGFDKTEYTILDDKKRVRELYKCST